MCLFLPLIQGFSVASSGCTSRSLSTFLVVNEEVVDKWSILAQTLCLRLTIFASYVENYVNNYNQALLELSCKIVVSSNKTSQLNDHY